MTLQIKYNSKCYPIFFHLSQHYLTISIIYKKLQISDDDLYLQPLINIKKVKQLILIYSYPTIKKQHNMTTIHTTS